MRGPLEQNSFLALLVLVTVAFLWLLKPFFAPIFWACAVALIFYPMQGRLLAKWPQRRTLSALVTLTVCTVVVVIPVLAVAASFVTEGVSLFQGLQNGDWNPSEYMEKFRTGFPVLYHGLERLGVDFSNFGDQIMAGVKTAGQFLGKRALAVGQNTFQFFIDLGLMLYLTFFLLRDGSRLVDLLIRALPLGDDREQLLFDKFAEVTRATIKGNLVVAAVQGALGGLIFWALGIPAALLWGVVMALLSLIPAVGAGLIWLPVSLYLFAVGDTVHAVILLLFGVLVIGLVDNVLRPILVGRDTKLPDYLVLFSTLGGLALFGITGFALGPLLAGLFVAFWQIFIVEFNQAGTPAREPAPAPSGQNSHGPRTSGQAEADNDSKNGQ